MQSPETNSQTYNYLIYEKGAIVIQWRKDDLYNK